MPNHEYTVALSVSGPGLDPGAVTRDLGLTPYRETGGSDPIWMYDGEPGDSGRMWSSLEDGLNSLLDELEFRRDALVPYVAQQRVVLWCGHFQSSLDGGPTFSAALLRRLGAFGIPLSLDNYFDSGG